MQNTQKDEIVRVGIVGADAKASWAKLSHVPAIAALPGVRLAAVATRSQTSAREAADAFGVEHAFGDPLAMIASDASDAVDVVTIAVRVPAHRDLVLAAIAAGKTVYCESPLGRNLAEAEEMAGAARAAGVTTAIGLQARYNPALRRATELIAAGAIGRPLHARVVSTSSGFGPAMPAAYDYFNQAASGADLSTITVAHTLDALETVLGRITEIDARGAILFPTVQLVDTGATSAREIPDQVAVLGRVESGCEFVVDVNGDIAPDRARFEFEVRGTDGWLMLAGGSMFGFQGGDLTLAASVPFDEPEPPAIGRDAPAPAINVGELYAKLANGLQGSRKGEHAAVAGFDEALRVARLVEQVGEASRSGTRTRIATP